MMRHYNEALAPSSGHQRACNMRCEGIYYIDGESLGNVLVPTSSAKRLLTSRSGLSHRRLPTRQRMPIRGLPIRPIATFR
jgi:hypothetical protein